MGGFRTEREEDEDEDEDDIMFERYTNKEKNIYIYKYV